MIHAGPLAKAIVAVVNVAPVAFIAIALLAHVWELGYGVLGCNLLIVLRGKGNFMVSRILNNIILSM